MTPSSTSSVKKLSVLLPAPLHLRAKRYALLSDQTLTDFLDAADAAPSNNKLN
jgi:hypothetical protein